MSMRPYKRALQGVPQYPRSTCILRFDYHPENGRLDILFTGGNRGSYSGVPEEIVATLARAGSAGRTYNAIIKGQFHYTPG